MRLLNPNPCKTSAQRTRTADSAIPLGDWLKKPCHSESPIRGPRKSLEFWNRVSHYFRFDEQAGCLSLTNRQSEHEVRIKVALEMK
jgi:hypothetical protein